MGTPQPGPMPRKLDAKIAYQRLHDFLERQSAGRLLPAEGEFVRRYDSDPTLARVANDLDAIEVRIQKTAEPRDRLEELVRRMFRDTKDVHFAATEIEVKTRAGQRLGLESLSSGEKHLLRILTEALRIDNGALIVDEPEISMHVDWQKALIASLHSLNPNLQIIAATHSPEIMAEIPDDKIFRV